MTQYIASSNWRPSVSIIIPALNESKYIDKTLAASCNQDYMHIVDIVVAIGPSKDGTENIVKQMAVLDPRIIPIENPTGRTPDALNLAIKRARGEVVVRCDAHAELPENYVSLAIETMCRTGAVNVGGIMDAKGESTFQRAVAYAMKSKFGVGNSKFHTGGEEGPVDTVYLGCFLAQAVKAIGGYDEYFTRAQDWEMNFRLRRAGGLVWFNPNLKVTYRPRNTISALATQYYQYGQWRRKVIETHPETLLNRNSLRYLVPPVAVIAFALSVILGVCNFNTGGYVLLYFAVPLLYILSLLVVSIKSIKELGIASSACLPVVLVIMHFSWALGFIKGVGDA